MLPTYRPALSRDAPHPKKRNRGFRSITLIGKEMQTLPFQLSSEADAWLSRLPHKDGQSPGFVYSPRYGVYRGADLVEEFGTAHYSFVYATAADWASERSATPLVIRDREFWITSDTLAGLRGKTLSVVQCDVGKKQSVVREFLVALEHASSAIKKMPIQSAQTTTGLRPVVSDLKRWAK